MSHTGRGGIPLSFAYGGIFTSYHFAHSCIQLLCAVFLSRPLFSTPKHFTNAEFGSIRVVEIDNNPWFVGKDVVKVLGYKNASKALSDHVEEEDKLNNESLSSLGQRGGWLVNESGLYSLIMSSKLPTAKQFKRWVTSEVLHAYCTCILTPNRIKYTGSYQTATPHDQI